MIGRKPTAKTNQTKRLNTTQEMIPPHDPIDPLLIMYAPVTMKESKKSNLRIPAATTICVGL